MDKLTIDWSNEQSHILINPKLPEEISSLLLYAVEPHKNLKSHIWIASSGTENLPKMIALSKKAILISAEAVNHHLEANSDGIWLNILPLFHAGGIGTHVRAHLSGAPIYDYSMQKWNAEEYVKLLDMRQAVFTSLTPTHIFDLTHRGLSPPKSLKKVIVGGGMLSHSLHQEAYRLGWPLLKSYGMTEVSSQIATAENFDPDAPMKILKHIELRFNDEQFIELKSEALFTGFVRSSDPQREFIDPKINGWYTTQDKGKVESGELIILGRGSNFLKIGGENINFSDLEQIWENVKVQMNCKTEAVLIDLPDERLGSIISLAVVDPEKKEDFQRLIEEYQKHVIHLAKVRHIYYVPFIPRTDLHKLKKKELRDLISMG